MVKSAEPTETSKCVRRPASRSRIPRSKPLAVVEVEQGLPVDDADGHGGELARERLRKPEAVEREARRDPRAGDRGAPRAPVGLEHVAVEPERALAQSLEVADAAQRATDQA